MKGFFDNKNGLFEEYDKYGDGGILAVNYFNLSEQKYVLRCAKKLYAITYGGGHCFRCGIDDPIILSFHHKDPTDKSETISNIIRGNGRNCSKKALEREVDKCRVVCSNCHAEIHCNDSSVSKNELLRILGGINFCTQCGYQSKDDNLSSLHFHHLRGFDKKFEISEVYSRSSSIPNFLLPMEEILEEAKKCIIICGNCHIIQHANYERFMRLKPLIYQKMEDWKNKQSTWELSGRIRKNPFGNKTSKRFDRKHKSDPTQNPYGKVDNGSPKEKIAEEWDRKMINI